VTESAPGKLVTEAFGYDDGRLVSVLVPLERADSVVFVADGGWHVSALSEALHRAGRHSTLIVGVHGLSDDDGRLHEYVFGFDPARFASHETFFVHEVGQWVTTRFAVELRPESSAVWGASLGGEFALAMGIRHPDVFGSVLACSPGAGFRPSEVMPNPIPRVYLLAGDDEPFFLDNAKRWAAALRDNGATVVSKQRPGEHGGSFWAEEFPLMVEWAFGQ
jgi:enterochelin esterase-like enzyme